MQTGTGRSGTRRRTTPQRGHSALMLATKGASARPGDPLRGRRGPGTRAPGPYDRPAVTPIAFAHRGARGLYPDNTLPGFRHALEHGATGLETDAWLSRDGQVVLVHDGNIRSGMFGRKLSVADTDAARLAELDVPTLADLYDAVGCDYELSVDLKDRAVDEPIVETTRRSGEPARTWLCVPSVERLRAIRETASDVRLVHSTRRARLPDSLERHAADLADAKID